MILNVSMIHEEWIDGTNLTMIVSGGAPWDHGDFFPTTITKKTQMKNVHFSETKNNCKRCIIDN